MGETRGRPEEVCEEVAFTAEDLAKLDPLLELNIRLLTLDAPSQYEPNDVVDGVMMGLEGWAEDATACPDAARRAWADRMWTRLDEDFSAYTVLVARVPLAETRVAIAARRSDALRLGC